MRPLNKIKKYFYTRTYIQKFRQYTNNGVRDLTHIKMYYHMAKEDQDISDLFCQTHILYLISQLKIV